MEARMAEILRVDHAGELAAFHIYRTQAKVFEHTRLSPLSAQFSQKEAEERVHFDRFETLMRERGVRPTAMTPIWRLAAIGLGGMTALMGEKAAHACTEAVETVIEDHYASQIAAIKDHDPALAAELEQFRLDEVGHRDGAVAQGAHDAPAYPLLSAIIKGGCRLAIKISEKL
jgi:ubiquinone biosynthesis monooxygenase Coq7